MFNEVDNIIANILNSEDMWWLNTYF
jgi:hypothetical protein